MEKKNRRCLFAVIGAGPYGLAVASHLLAAGLDVRIFGKAMDFWDSHMPKGMLLRSPREGSHIADPERAFTLDRFEETECSKPQCTKLPKEIPLEDFVRYGQWFQRRALPDLDIRHVASIERANDGFCLTLEDGEPFWAGQVVIATGIGAFPNIPASLATLPPELVSHSSARANRDLNRFSGRHVLVVGSGQSAVESAALLSEAGAQVEILLRQPQLRFLRNRPFVDTLMNSWFNPFKTPGKIGPLGINWLIEHPFLFTSFSRGVQDWMAERAIRPAASSWLRSRIRGVTLHSSREVCAATAYGNKVRLRLTDGTDQEADHVLLGTGYKIRLERYPFLAPHLLEAIRTANGYPILNQGFESSIPGLYFVGATAAYSFGPLCRFVAGTRFTAATLTHFVRKQSIVPLSLAHPFASNHPQERQLT